MKLKKKAAVQKPMLEKQMSYSLYILEFERMMKLQMRRTDPVRALTSMSDSESLGVAMIDRVVLVAADTSALIRNTMT